MLRRVSLLFFCGVLSVYACSSSSADDAPSTSFGGSAGMGAGASGGLAGSADGSLGGAGSGGLQLDGQSGDGDIPVIPDPKTCAEAQAAKTYIGCEFWPTVVANGVWSIFDYAVVVANAGDKTADITIERAGVTVQQGSVPPNGLTKFYLPWVPALKGPDSDSCATPKPLPATVRATGGAYHLVSTVPVTAYQFNAIEYKGEGGPSGKSWLGCPGDQACSTTGQSVGCFSFSNDASLLLPSSSLTGNYRVTGQMGWTPGGVAPYFAVTGTENTTKVTVKVGSKGQVISGGGVTAALANQVISFSLNRGDVVQVVGTPSTDLSGSLIQADKVVQVITGVPCIRQPFGEAACDHIEESVFPAETLGKHYFVSVPTGPNGDAVGHVVRIYGNADDTSLTYPGLTPLNAPTKIDAGKVYDLGVVDADFEVLGDHEFGVGTFLLGGAVVDPQPQPGNEKGDPAQSALAAVEQFRKKYVFLAPDDYDVSYADVVMPEGAEIVLDGVPITVTPQPISSGWAVARLLLGPGAEGAHVLTSNQAFGLQVMGYGTYTSYHYPGGLNLSQIAPPPKIF
jgi:hypothetical protein